MLLQNNRGNAKIPIEKTPPPLKGGAGGYIMNFTEKERTFLVESLLKRVQNPDGMSENDIRSSIINWFNLVNFTDEEIDSFSAELLKSFPVTSDGE